MTIQQELIILKNKFLVLQQQLNSLKQFNLYINEIEYFCVIIDKIDILTISQIEKIEEQINLKYLLVVNDLNISIQFKRIFLQLIKKFLNILISLSVIKIYDSI